MSLVALFSDNELISSEQFSKGFSRVIEDMADLELDTPNAAALTAAIRAQAVVDKVLVEVDEEKAA